MSHEHEEHNPADNLAPFKIEVAERVKRLPPYLFGRINALKYQKRRAGDDVIDLGMGNPSDPPEDLVIEKLAEAARDPRNHGYSKPLGIANLRREVASKYLQASTACGSIPRAKMIVCLGSKEGFSHMCLALMGPGDTAIVPAPYFPVHVYAVALASGNVHRARSADSEKFLSNIAYTCQHLYPKPKLLILNYPHNPSTVTVEPEFFVEVVKLARRYGFMVISDFAYADVAFDGYQPPSFLAAPGATDVGVEFTTMSKGYNMAGWRVGFCAGNRRDGPRPGHDQGLLRLRHVPADPDRRDHGPAAQRRRGRGPSRSINSRRDVLCDGLRRIGWDITPPRAGMFVWAKIPELWAEPDGHDELRHEAAGRRRRGRQPRQRLRPGRRRLSAAGTGRKRKPPAPGRATDRPLFGGRTQDFRRYIRGQTGRTALAICLELVSRPAQRGGQSPPVLNPAQAMLPIRAAAVRWPPKIRLTPSAKMTRRAAKASPESIFELPRSTIGKRDRCLPDRRAGTLEQEQDFLLKGVALRAGSRRNQVGEARRSGSSDKHRCNLDFSGQAACEHKSSLPGS